MIGASIQKFSFARALQAFPLFTPERQQHLEKIVRTLPLTVQTALIAALEAWYQAALNVNPLDATRIGLVVAAQNTTNHYQYDLHTAFQQNPDYLLPAYALHFMDTDHVGVLSEVLGIMGEGFTVGGSSVSGNVALIRGYQLIRDHYQDACLVIGALADLSPMDLQGFYNLGALGGHHFAAEPKKACRPFDKAHDGFIYGQAAAAVMLESLDSAKRRDVPILGYMLGGALLLDGNRLANPNQNGEVRVMQQAMKAADVSVEEVNYINTHGTSAPLGDQTEINAIEAIFNECGHEVMLNATKSITGHCLWSAGVVEAIATLIQIRGEFLHPSLNLEQPITEKSQFVLGQNKSFRIQIALSNSFGFGGINSTLVLAKTIPCAT